MNTPQAATTWWHQTSDAGAVRATGLRSWRLIRRLLCAPALVTGLASGLCWTLALAPGQAQAQAQAGALRLGAPAACRSYTGLPPAGAQVLIKGGRFTMGSDRHYPEEGARHTVEVRDFWIDAHAVTNAQFEKFVRATGYRTLAERGLSEQATRQTGSTLNGPGSMVFTVPRRIVMGELNWWRFVPTANWRHPEGQGSDLRRRANHPVVHIAREDAQAYARWLGRDLPTEAEFEFAARGGGDTEFAWGTALYPDGKAMANIWQGEFPTGNTGTDGHIGTAPVGCFAANGYGLFDMIGNVWQWTRDAWRPMHTEEAQLNPDIDLEDALQARASTRTFGVIKGGSFLCSPMYCKRYRPSARHAQELVGSTNHIGFRTVLRPPAAAR